MLSVLGGFTTVWAVIALGWFLGRVGLLDNERQLVLNDVAFYVGNPCLLFLLMSRADLHRAFAANMLVNMSATVLAGLTYIALAAWLFRPGARGMVIGTFVSCYVNAANLGLPIAAYVLHDMSWMAPVLLFQTALLQPLGVTVLDVLEGRSTGRQSAWWVNLTIPFRNPLTAGTLAGLLVNLLHIRLPALITDPVGLVGQISVPLMLIAFGVALQVNGLPGRGPQSRQVWTATALKLVWHPLLAYVLARYAFGLPPETVFACTVLGGLPSAQNIFVIAQRYRAAVTLARDGTFLDTLLSIPTLLVISLLLHPA